MRCKARLAIALIAVFLASASQVILAQQPRAEGSDQVARRSDLYCTGFIAQAAPREDLKVIGAESENIKATFAQGDTGFSSMDAVPAFSGAVVLRHTTDRRSAAPIYQKEVGYFVRELGLQGY